MPCKETPHIDWTIPPDRRPDWLAGTGATIGERLITLVGAAIGVAATIVVAFAGQVSWSWWQAGLAVVIAADLFGGAVANSTNAVKRQYFGPSAAGSGLLTRVLRDPVAFAALHVHPFIIIGAYGDPGGWAWATSWYLLVLTAVTVISRWTPLYLRRPAAMLVFTIALVLSLPLASSDSSPLSAILTASPGWAWFPAVYVAKLVLAHAVREEPYRPRR